MINSIVSLCICQAAYLCCYGVLDIATTTRRSWPVAHDRSGWRGSSTRADVPQPSYFAAAELLPVNWSSDSERPTAKNGQKQNSLWQKALAGAFRPQAPVSRNEARIPFTKSEAARELGISEVNFHRWKNHYSAMSTSEAPQPS